VLKPRDAPLLVGIPPDLVLLTWSLSPATPPPYGWFMALTNLYPTEGTWNIRLWRSAEDLGIYRLELQDPGAGGVQTGEFAMRFPTPDHAHAWLSHFAAVSTPLEQFNKGRFLRATGEARTWHPIILALHHAAGPMGVFYESMWWYGSSPPITEVDPLADKSS
jgi:hypothetical protein